MSVSRFSVIFVTVKWHFLLFHAKHEKLKEGEREIVQFYYILSQNVSAD